MEKFDKGAKRKCNKCNILFFDFEKHPIVCPSCGAEINSLLTNVSKRGRPPKVQKPDLEEVKETKDLKIEEIDVQESSEDIDPEESNVEDIVAIEREKEKEQ